MKKFLGFIFTVVLAFVAAYYTTGVKNGYKDPFDVNFDLESFLRKFQSEDNLFYYPEGMNDKEIAQFRIARAKKEMAAYNTYDAISVLNDAKKYDASNIEIYTLLSDCYTMTYDYSNSIIELQEILKIDSLNTAVKLKIADNYILMKDNKSASTQLAVILKHNPSDTSAIFKLADCYSADGDTENALRILKTTDVNNAVVRIADIYFRAKEYKPAV